MYNLYIVFINQYIVLYNFSSPFAIHYCIIFRQFLLCSTLFYSYCIFFYYCFSLCNCISISGSCILLFWLQGSPWPRKFNQSINQSPSLSLSLFFSFSLSLSFSAYIYFYFHFIFILYSALVLCVLRVLLKSLREFHWYRNVKNTHTHTHTHMRLINSWSSRNDDIFGMKRHSSI